MGHVPYIYVILVEDNPVEKNEVSNYPCKVDLIEVYTNKISKVLVHVKKLLPGYLLLLKDNPVQKLSHQNFQPIYDIPLFEEILVDSTMIPHELQCFWIKYNERIH